MSRILPCALLAACALLVFWIRTLPLSLSVINERAERVVRTEISERIAREEIPRDHLSPREWTAEVKRKAREWVQKNGTEYQSAVVARARELKLQLRRADNDGREHVYLGDLDSYLWLRNARNYLRHGTTCDAVIAGECRDTYSLAPVGHRMVYNRALHIAAIVGVYKLIRFFDPDYPLFAASFWVPVLVGVLGVIPAFFVGRRLAGNIGGLFAAVMISLHPVFLTRSIGSDNDVWNVVLPAFCLWAVIEALNARGVHLIGWAMIAGAVTGLHTVTWSGWKFFYLVFLCGLLLHLGLSAPRFARAQRTYRWWRSPEVGRLALVCATYYVAAGLAVILTGSDQPYFTLPLKVLGLSGSGAPAGDVGSLAGEVYWPNAFETVAELARPQVGLITVFMGAGIYMVAAATGLALMFLSRSRHQRVHIAFLLGAASLFAYVILFTDLDRNATVLLLALPFVVAALLSLPDDPSTDDAARRAAMILATWFTGAFYLAYGGLRFLLLLVVPFGIGFAFVMGRLFGAFRTVAAEVSRSPAQRNSWDIAICGVVLLFLVPPVHGGYAVGRNYLPRIDDAWWDALVKIRDESRPDAIVNAWWDYGYWIKYVAERRVSADGGSLRTHVPHWLAKALVAPDERETIGILRMLNCGSDATPLPEGKLGAYGKILAAGRDGAEAYAIVSAIVTMSEGEARSYLAQRGFTDSQRADILRSSHCAPPESFLILNSDLRRKAQVWMPLGLWDIRKAYIADRAALLSQDEALSDFARLDFPEPEALSLYSQAKTLRSPEERENFAAPEGEAMASLSWRI
jgi:Ca2+/Na+ antiporter